nr:acyl-homoserine-lactone synthase [Agrobacterium salinitolerans]
MHRLRAAVFGGRLEWDITVTEQGERDQYDDLRPTYILAISADQKVVGCARLLPASGPTMLERTFPQLLERGSLDAHAAVVESSRFCVDTSQAAGRGGAFIRRRSPCSPASSNGQWPTAPLRSSQPPISASSAF